jgi:hypothetical protein
MLAYACAVAQVAETRMTCGFACRDLIQGHLFKTIHQETYRIIQEMD